MSRAQTDRLSRRQRSTGVRMRLTRQRWRPRNCFTMRNTITEEELKEKLGSGDKDNMEQAVQNALDGLDKKKMRARVLVHCSAPSHAWSTRCGWQFSTQGFRLFNKRQDSRSGAGGRHEEDEGADFQVKQLRAETRSASLSKKESLKYSVAGWAEHRRVCAICSIKLTVVDPSRHTSNPSRSYSNFCRRY